VRRGAELRLTDQYADGGCGAGSDDQPHRRHVRRARCSASSAPGGMDMGQAPAPRLRPRPFYRRRLGPSGVSALVDRQSLPL
jgi:hypothetical protein